METTPNGYRVEKDGNLFFIDHEKGDFMGHLTVSVRELENILEAVRKENQKA